MQSRSIIFSEPTNYYIFKFKKVSLTLRKVVFLFLFKKNLFTAKKSGVLYNTGEKANLHLGENDNITKNT